jgi:hypothetical protein
MTLAHHTAYTCRTFICTLFIIPALYSAATSARELSDCFEGRIVTVPNLTTSYHPLLFEQWFTSSTKQFQTSEVKLLIGVGILSGPNPIILQTAADLAYAVVKSSVDEQTITALTTRDLLLTKIRSKLIEHQIPDTQAQQIDLSYASFINSHDFIQQPTALILPNGMESALTPTERTVDDAAFAHDLAQFSQMAARLCCQAEHIHHTMVLVPQLAAYNNYIKQRFATRLKLTR